MPVSRRDFTKLIAGAGAFAAVSQLDRTISMAQTLPEYRAMVAIFLYGGHDGWNMLVPTDSRYAGYASAREGLALKSEALLRLSGTPFGLHPALAPLAPAWSDGAMGVVMNTGSLLQPLNRNLFDKRPDLRPLNLMSHSDEQDHWEGMRVREASRNGFLGRIADRSPATATPSLISICGSSLALIGNQASPLVLPPTGDLKRDVVTGSKDPQVKLRAALDAYRDASGEGALGRGTASAVSNAFDQAVAADAVISAASANVDAYFKDPATGGLLDTRMGRQLLRAARMIEARNVLGHTRQTFFVSQQGYDTHSNQVEANDSSAGRQAELYAELAVALSCFYKAMKGLGLSRNVTAFTMSDFGRVYKGNAQLGSDHAWGNNHLVLGGALAPRKVHGRYPDPVLGGPEDARGDGRWIPSIAIEEYIGSIARWYGVADADMPYVFPNWATWNGGGRGPVPLFG